MLESHLRSTYIPPSTVRRLLRGSGEARPELDGEIERRPLAPSRLIVVRCMALLPFEILWQVQGEY